MKTKLLFENWRRYLTEAVLPAGSDLGKEVGMPVRPDRVRELRGDMDPLSKEELEALLPGGKIADPMNPRSAGPDDLMPLGKKDGFAYYKSVSGAQWSQVPIKKTDSEFATAGGMEQDIEMRQKRGDFEQGDYGNVGPGGGETVDYGEYPWIKTALDDLKDEEAPDKEKALQALADELGVSITMSPDED